MNYSMRNLVRNLVIILPALLLLSGQTASANVLTWQGGSATWDTGSTSDWNSSGGTGVTWTDTVGTDTAVFGPSAWPAR